MTCPAACVGNRAYCQPPAHSPAPNCGSKTPLGSDGVDTRTYCVVPAVHRKQSAAGHGHHGRDGQVGQRVGCHVGHRRVWWELQHHDHILLHLIFKHEWTLWKETLLNRKGREQKKTEGITQLVSALGRRRLTQTRLAWAESKATRTSIPWEWHGERGKGSGRPLAEDTRSLTTSLDSSLAGLRVISELTDLSHDVVALLSAVETSG